MSLEVVPTGSMSSRDVVGMGAGSGDLSVGSGTMGLVRGDTT